MMWHEWKLTESGDIFLWPSMSSKLSASMNSDKILQTHGHCQLWQGVMSLLEIFLYTELIYECSVYFTEYVIDLWESMQIYENESKHLAYLSVQVKKNTESQCTLL